MQNEHFINIKVDMEERPDVDQIYMNFVQITTGRGGWPMNVFITISAFLLGATQLDGCTDERIPLAGRVAGAEEQVDGGEHAVQALGQLRPAVAGLLAALLPGEPGLSRERLDDIPVPQVSRFQDELREYLRTEGSVYEGIRETKDLSDELQEKLTSEIEKFKESFAVKEDTGLVGAAS